MATGCLWILEVFLHPVLVWTGSGARPEILWEIRFAPPKKPEGMIRFPNANIKKPYGFHHGFKVDAPENQLLEAISGSQSLHFVRHLRPKSDSHSRPGRVVKGHTNFGATGTSA